MKNQFGRLLVVLMVAFSLMGLINCVQVNASQNNTQQHISKIVHRDMKHVGGTWSVKVTKLSKPSIVVITGNHGVRTQRSASTIKVFIMLATYYQIQHHRLKTTAAIQSNLKRMIYYSDNTAANDLIRKVGGFKRVTRLARQFGFTHTHLRRFMLDNNALRHHRDNYTSVNDLTQFLTKAYEHQLLGKHYDKRMLQLLHGCQNHTKLPKLVKHAVVYNKTGELPVKGVQNDAALFKTRHGVYTIVVMSEYGRQFYQYQAMNHLGRDVINYLNTHK